MKGLCTFCIFILCLSIGRPQPAKYWVEFTDKANSPYSLFRPYEFLSAKSLERRAHQGIPLDEADLPVNPAYLNALKQFGASIHNRSRWMNAATIVADSATVADISGLPFVELVKYVGKHLTKKRNIKEIVRPDSLPPYEALPEYYGYGTAQISLMNGQFLHQIGFQGQGKMIAVLDGGFANVPAMPFFDSLRQKGQLVAGYDFADNDISVFESSSHGTQVLSAMAAHLPGLLVGTAPGASYLLIKTEDTRGEYLVEECNWVAGAEYADSLGADIINSSLGYTTFNDKSMDYRYQEMDGHHSLASRAADVAFSKGMLLVNSAGNNGNDDWRYIGAPADSRSVLSVGATTRQGELAGFSSVGPTSDGRLKPNISTLGQSVVVGSSEGYEMQLANGTSLASPLAAGMAAALWSAFPEKSNTEIFDAIEESGHLFKRLNFKMGYGIPDFLKAYLILKKDDGYPDRQGNSWLLRDEELNTAEIVHYSATDQTMVVQLRDISQEVVLQEFTASLQAETLSRIPVPDFDQLATGLYVVRLFSNSIDQYFLIAR